MKGTQYLEASFIRMLYIRNYRIYFY